MGRHQQLHLLPLVTSVEEPAKLPNNVITITVGMSLHEESGRGGESDKQGQFSVWISKVATMP